MDAEDKQAGIDSIKGRDLFGNLIVGWNDQFQTLTDLGGLPLSRTEAKALRSLINQHLKKSSADLASVAQKLDPYNRGSFDPERYE